MKTRSAVRGRPFSSRNPTTIGAIGLVLILLLLYAAFNASKLPLIGGGTTYSAAFTETAGLAPQNEVRIAGVRVGAVDKVTLEGDHVRVTFKVKNAFVGDQSKVNIKLKTLLGTKYLEVDSEGGNKQDPDKEIPTSRTTSPFDVYPAFAQLSKTIDSINTDQLAQAFTTLADTFRDTPSSTRQVIDGLSRLSQTISSRDQELQQLLAAANNVTGTLASRDAVLQKLIADGGLILDELNARRDQIHQLLVNTTILSAQLEGLVNDNQNTLKPALDQVHGVLQILNNNQDALDRGLQLLAPFFRVFTNTLGNGRWFDTYICNLSVTGLATIGAPITDDCVSSQ